MRELTKSMTSYAWAMSLFGLQQMVNVFRPGKATESFNNVTKATEEEFGDALKATFRAGDNLQKGLVDVTFGVLMLGAFDRSAGSATANVARQTGEALRQGGRIVNRTVDTVTRTVQAGTAAVAGATQQSQRRNDAPSASTGAPGRQQGWGPVSSQG